MESRNIWARMKSKPLFKQRDLGEAKEGQDPSLVDLHPSGFFSKPLDFFNVFVSQSKMNSKRCNNLLPTRKACERCTYCSMLSLYKLRYISISFVRVKVGLSLKIKEFADLESWTSSPIYGHDGRIRTVVLDNYIQWNIHESRLKC